MYLHLFSRQLWPSAATRGKIGFSGGIHDWLATGSWSISDAVVRKKANIALHDYDQFNDACINDAFRLGSAAFESAHAVDVCKEDSRSFAWQFIAYYYSGYFAANALMRLCGYACTNINAMDCAEINQCASLYGLGGTEEKNKIVPGVYYSTTTRSPADTWTLSAISSKGGVHIQFWTGFLKFLLELERYIKDSPNAKSDKDAAGLEIRMLIEGLKFSNTNSGAWLSEVRNAINYRLEYGAWFPYADAENNGVDLKNIILSAMDGRIALPQNAGSIPAPIRASKISAFMLAWLKESLVTLSAATSKEKKRMLEEGPLKVAAAMLGR